MNARRQAPAGLLAVALTAASLADPAAAAPSPRLYDITIDSAAAAYFIENPRPLPHHLGYARVNLRHDAGRAVGRCEATGAGYLLAPEVEDGAVLDIVDQDQDPAATGSGGGYYNPTVARAVAPDSVRNPRLGTTDPAVYGPDRPGTRLAPVPHDAPTPLRWTAACPSAVSGSATGTNLVVPGADVASGDAHASVDRAGRYTGLARGHVSGAYLASATSTTISSLLRVVADPGAEPRVTYELSLGGLDTGSDGAEARTHVERDAVTLAGTDIPVSQLRRQFNAAVRANSSALSALGPAGLALLKPEVRRGPDGRLAITAPAVTTNAGLALRRGDLGQNVSVIFGFASVLIGGVPNSSPGAR